MSLIKPDFGLLFWMLITFGIVVFVLARYGFPIIVKMVEERKRYIEESLQQAEQARAELTGVKAESQAIITQARQEHIKILHNAEELGSQMIDQSKEKAAAEAEKILAETRARIELEKERALSDIRRQIADLSVLVAEKALMEKLGSRAEQEKMLNRLLDQIETNQS
jgi:F-type H+-transporting ATPase subunit b